MSIVISTFFTDIVIPTDCSVALLNIDYIIITENNMERGE